MVVKDNQKGLKEEVSDLFELEPLPEPQAVQVNKGHGRVEVRRLWASSELAGYSDWPGLSQGLRLEREVTRKGKTEREVAYAITSVPATRTSPKLLLSLWRGHWGIEDRVHWVRDVTFDEDRSQVRSGSAPQVMAAIRNLAISLLRLAGKPNIAAALRRCAAHPEEAFALLGVPYE